MLYHSTTGDTLRPLFGLWERKHFDTQIWLFHNQSLKWKGGLAISPSPSLSDSISAIDFSVVMDGQCRNERHSWFKLLYRVLRRSLRFLTRFLDINRIYAFCWWMHAFKTKFTSSKLCMNKMRWLLVKLFLILPQILGQIHGFIIAPTPSSMIIVSTVGPPNVPHQWKTCWISQRSDCLRW